MVKYANMMSLLLLAALACAGAQGQSKDGVSVEVVATVTEYIASVPASQDKPKSERSYTDCSGETSYIGDFAHTHISCSTVSRDEGESGTTRLARGVSNAMGGGLLTGKPKTRYTVVRSDHALYLLSCAEHWRWSKCPTLAIGAKYALRVRNNSSDVQLQDVNPVIKPFTLQYISGVALPTSVKEPELPKVEPASTPSLQQTITGAAKLRGVLDVVILREAFTNPNGVVFVTMESVPGSPGHHKSNYQLSCNRGEENCRMPSKNATYTMFDYGNVQYECQNVGLYQGTPNEIEQNARSFPQSGAGAFFGVYCLDGLQ